MVRRRLRTPSSTDQFSRAGLAASMELVILASVLLVWRDGRDYGQFRSRVSAIDETCLNITDVGSAERLARTTTRQPLTNGTRTSNKTTRRPDKMPYTGRNTSIGQF